MAGGGGAVHGKSDSIGAYPVSNPVTPADLAATVFWRFGLNLKDELHDPLGRPFSLANGKPIDSIFG